MNSRLASILLAMLALPAMASLTLAQDKAKAKVLGNFGDWQALSYKEAAGDVCYVASLPKKSEGHQIKPGEASVLVTHWPAKKSLGVISVTAGYEYKKDSEVQLVIGSEKFKLFTQGKTAWARDGGGDAKIVEAMKTGKELIAQGLTGKDAKTIDTYSLNGFAKAYEAASKACGVKG